MSATISEWVSRAGMQTLKLLNTVHRVCREVGDILVSGNQTVCTVESCTGGGIAYAITAVAGSSNWFERGYVTYSNDAKSSMVNVPRELLREHGAVSVEVAESMAMGGRQSAGAEFALAVTGIAGPGGGSKEKPVGTVCFGWAGPGVLASERIVFDGDREMVRSQTTLHALSGLLEMLKKTE